MWFKQTSITTQANQRLEALKSSGVDMTIDELVLYQSKSALINLAPSKQFFGHMAGNSLAKNKGRGMEFDEVRHYQTGDDIRAIDWRVTARTGKTHTKLFREEIERPVLIATDLSDSMRFGSQLLFKSVQAGHIAALVAWHAKKRGDKVGGMIFTDSDHLELKPQSRQQGVLHYLHALTQMHNVQSNDNISAEDAELAFANNCQRLRKLSKPGGLIYLITDGTHFSEQAIRHLRTVSMHCELVICLVHDPIERQLPEASQTLSLAFTDGRNRQTINVGDKKWRPPTRQMPS